MNRESFYLRLPIPLQNAACSLEGWRIQRSRFGPGFRERLRAAEERQGWPAERVIEYRDARIREFVRHCVETVPYYRRRAASWGIAPDRVRGLEDLAQIPVLTKAEIQEAPEEFLSEAVPSDRHLVVHTSGTTGAGLRFPSTLEAVQEQWAVWWRFLRRHGLRQGTWCGYFGGRSVVPLSQRTPPFWRTNWPGGQILFSAYHMSPSTLDAYLGELRRRNPPWLHGYPSLLALLAGHALEQGHALGYQPCWITTGAESLLPQQADLIGAAFGRRPVEQYGMAEAVANCSQCLQRRFHVDEDFAAVEFVEADDLGGAKVVGSSLSNLAMPFLRYEVDDVVQLEAAGCACGIPGRVVSSIDGRNEDYLVLRDGARLGLLDHVFKDMVRVREAQIFQSVPGEIVVRVVRASGWSERDEAMLLHEFRTRVGDLASVRIEYFDRIPKGRTGKLKFVVSEIPEARQLAPTRKRSLRYADAGRGGST